MLGEGYGSPDNVFQVTKGARGKKYCTKIYADDEQASMTMNESE